jgi:hypothetical protein
MSIRKSRKFGAGIPQGIPSMDLEIFDETFKVRGQVSGVKLLNVMKALENSSAKAKAAQDGNAAEDDDDSMSEIDVVLDFLEFAFLVEDRERAMKFLEEQEAPPVDMPMLMEIFQWLIGEYTGNPTEPPTESEPGSQSDGIGSSETAEPTAAPTSEPSTPTNSGQSAQLISSAPVS